MNQQQARPIPSAVLTVNMYAAGDLWRMRLNYVRDVLCFINVVLKRSVRPRVRAFLVEM